MSEDDYEPRLGAMRDKEKEERMAQSNLDAPVFMYRLGESRKFANATCVPEGEGWVDSPAKVRPMPQIQPVEAVSGLEALPEPSKLPAASDSPRRPGRKPRNA